MRHKSRLARVDFAQLRQYNGKVETLIRHAPPDAIRPLHQVKGRKVAIPDSAICAHASHPMSRCRISVEDIRSFRSGGVSWVTISQTIKPRD